ncbi:MAG: FadR family transcriptional regulator [Caldilineae bacterium]|nr:MAG: FadR family transcriptional regulator [Caldilineae bacterium]
MFRRTPRHRLYEDVVRQIETAILDGRLRAGDRLPPQRELMAQFQTSRASVREALRVLEQKGLIEIRLGANGGAFVRDVDLAPASESLALLIRRQEVSLEELAEFRAQVEGEVGALAALRAREEDVRELQALLEQAEACLHDGVTAWSDFCSADHRIHTRIAEACGNTLYAFVIHAVHDNIQRYYERYPLQDVAHMAENLRDLQAIVAAIAARDQAEARRLMREHVQRFTQYMLHHQDAVSSATGRKTLPENSDTTKESS